ncbi:PAS domain-containing protein [Halosimplex marinum]
MTDYQELFKKIPDGVTLHDAEDGSVLDANEEFCEMLGYERTNCSN